MAFFRFLVFFSPRFPTTARPFHFRQFPFFRGAVCRRLRGFADAGRPFTRRRRRRRRRRRSDAVCIRFSFLNELVGVTLDGGADRSASVELQFFRRLVIVVVVVLRRCFLLLDSFVVVVVVMIVVLVLWVFAPAVSSVLGISVSIPLYTRRGRFSGDHSRRRRRRRRRLDQRLWSEIVRRR